jgi:hypothetical protein
VHHHQRSGHPWSQRIKWGLGWLNHKTLVDHVGIRGPANGWANRPQGPQCFFVDTCARPWIIEAKLLWLSGDLPVLELLSALLIQKA